MRKPFGLIMFLLILTVGCTSLSASPALTPATLTAARPVLNSTPTAIVTLQPTPTRIISAPTNPLLINIPPTTISPAPTQEVFSPQLMSVCPKKQVVLFEELELPQDFRIMLLPSSVQSYPQVPAKPLSLSPGNPTPQPIIDDELLSYDVSPNHQWISFYRPGDNEKRTTLWISSLDGKKQWPVIQLGGKGYLGFAVWVSDQEMFIVGSPRAEEYEELTIWDYFPFMSINPFTLEQRSLTYLAGGPMSGIHYYGALSSQGHSYALYGRLNLADYLYDYEQEKALPVFQWLNELDLVKSITIRPVWVYDGDKFAVTVARPDGLDVAMGLDIRSASEGKRYNEVMKKILLPERLLPLDVLGIGPQGLLALQRAGYASPIGGPDWFYVFDYQNMSIRDYCLDLSDGVWSAEFSPDGRFAAFTLQRSGAMLNKSDHYVAIIDLDKGTVAYLEGYIVVGWGIVTESP